MEKLSVKKSEGELPIDVTGNMSRRELLRGEDPICWEVV